MAKISGKYETIFIVNPSLEEAAATAEGVYTLIRFESKPEFPAELDRIYKITDGVMRSIIVSLDD